MALIHIAVVQLKTGNNIFASTTRENLIAQVADWCREWWGEEDALIGEEMPAHDEDLVTLYFDVVHDEFLNIEETELTGTEAEPRHA